MRAPSEQTEGTRSQVLRWLKDVGETVAENEPLIEIETDKVTVEMPAPAGGVLREILKQEQDEIEPGELLGADRGRAPLHRTLTAEAAAAAGGGKLRDRRGPRRPRRRRSDCGARRSRCRRCRRS